MNYHRAFKSLQPNSPDNKFHDVASTAPCGCTAVSRVNERSKEYIVSWVRDGKGHYSDPCQDRDSTLDSVDGRPDYDRLTGLDNDGNWYGSALYISK